MYLNACSQNASINSSWIFQRNVCTLTQNYYTALDIVYLFLTFKNAIVYFYRSGLRSAKRPIVVLLGDAFHPYSNL